MATYLLDTNVLLRAADPGAATHAIARSAIQILVERGDVCVLTSQVLVEFWVVATRPVDVNGLGWTIETTRQAIEDLLANFPLLEDSPEVFRQWLHLVSAYQIAGKRVHDARLAATAIANSVEFVLTFNTGDFAAIQELQAIEPQTLLP